MSDVMFTSSPDRLRAEARRRGLIGAATEFRRSCGQAEPRGSVRCVWVCADALCAEVASGTNLYLDLKNGERDLVAEGEKGQTATDWWQWREGKLPQNVYNV